MKYSIQITVDGDKAHVVCKEANIDQGFLTEDLPELLKDLPNLIN